MRERKKREIEEIEEIEKMKRKNKIYMKICYIFKG